MKVLRTIKTDAGTIGIFEKSFRIDGCAETAFTGVHTDNFPPEFWMALEAYINMAFKKGEYSKENEVEQTVQKLLSYGGGRK